MIILGLKPRVNIGPYMQVIRYLQQKTRPFPWIYNLLVLAYSVFAEIGFFFHAIITGKLFDKLRKNRVIEFLPNQEILSYPVKNLTIQSVDDLRDWLKKQNIVFMEGGWTFYLPPQEGLRKLFGSFLQNYPAYSGLKILKDLRHPNQARYTNHRQNPAPGAALKRLLTPTPIALVRVANYLFYHDIGIRIYDLISLYCGNLSLTCYVVQHLDGYEIRQKDYDIFINRIKTILDEGDLSTIHERVNIMWDFQPPDCNGNLIYDDKVGKPLYVDFQTFYLRREDKILEKILTGIQDKLNYKGPLFNKEGKRYPYQQVHGLSLRKEDIKNFWQCICEMLVETGCSLKDRVVYHVGCGTGLILYDSLACGALWGIGWDMPEVISGAERILLSLGATRFDLFGDHITEDYHFLKCVPERFKSRNNGMLYFLGDMDHMGFPMELLQVPWEYMFYEGHAHQSYDMTLEMLNQILCFEDLEVISHRVFSDGDTFERVVILLKRQPKDYTPR